MFYTHLLSPIGRLMLAGTDEALYFLSFPSGHKAFGPAPDWVPSAAPFTKAARQITAYFKGELTEFSLPLHLSGTEFQRHVWRRLAVIPFGQTTTYGALAAQIGRPNSSRAVGAANANNPLPIILPCHRVIGANGALTGFGGGLPTKEHLLRHEGVLPPASTQPSLF